MLLRLDEITPSPAAINIRMSIFGESYLITKRARRGATGRELGSIRLGLMGMSAFYTGGVLDDEPSIRTTHRAIELGMTFFDAAEIHKPCIHHELLAKAIAVDVTRSSSRAGSARPCTGAVRDGS